MNVAIYLAIIAIIISIIALVIVIVQISSESESTDADTLDGFDSSDFVKTTEQMKVYTKDLTSYDFFFETPNNELVFQGVGDCDNGDQILNVIHQSETGLGNIAMVDEWIDYSDGAVSVIVDALNAPTENVRGILVCLDLTP